MHDPYHPNWEANAKIKLFNASNLLALGKEFASDEGLDWTVGIEKGIEALSAQGYDYVPESDAADVAREVFPEKRTYTFQKRTN